MNYADYQTFIMSSVWRTGDASLAADLPELIRKAEDRIYRSIKEHNLYTMVTIPAFTGNEINLPADCGEVMLLQISGQPPSVLTTLHQVLTNAQLAPDSGLAPARIYAIVGKTAVIYPKAVTPTTYILHYYKKPVPYDTNPTEPFRDTMTAMFDAAVLVQVHTYLREYDEASRHEATYAALLADMIADNYYKAFPSGETQLPLPGLVF